LKLDDPLSFNALLGLASKLGVFEEELELKLEALSFCGLVQTHFIS
jgi:hypothetical protein